MTRPFAWTGVPVPVIGQGTWMIEGSPESAIAALRTGIDLGLTHIDTAEMYGSGRAEEITGQAIAGRRDSLFLVSKVLPSNASYEGTLRACEQSLKRLGTDHLDLYLLHWESSYPIAETMRAMERLIDQRQIRFAGVSNFDVDQLREAQAALPNHKLASNQVLYHLRERGIERKLIPYCAEHQIAVVGYTPFGRDKFPSPDSPGGRVLAGIAKQHVRHGSPGGPQLPDSLRPRLHHPQGVAARTHARKRGRHGVAAFRPTKSPPSTTPFPHPPATRRWQCCKPPRGGIMKSFRATAEPACFGR